MPDHTIRYHVMLLAPGLPASWFFQAAREYWLRCRPIVTDDPEYLALLPEGGVRITILSRPGEAEHLRAQVIRLLGQDAEIELVIAPDLPQAEVALNRLAAPSCGDDTQ
jgi:hypothetical protein